VVKNAGRLKPQLQDQNLPSQVKKFPNFLGFFLVRAGGLRPYSRGFNRRTLYQISVLSILVVASYLGWQPVVRAGEVKEVKEVEGGREGRGDQEVAQNFLPTIAQDVPLGRESWQNSPVLQRWQQRIPNVLEDIENDPSFRMRWRLGYGESGQQGSVNIGVEDVFLGDRLTLSGDYQSGAQNTYGAELRYYLLPLGNYANAAPVLGYRQVNTPNFSTNGVSMGARVQVVLSRPSAADIALSQTWIAPGGSQEVALTSLTLGYAVTSHLRVGTQWQLQNSRQQSDRRVGIFVEFY